MSGVCPEGTVVSGVSTASKPGKVKSFNVEHMRIYQEHLGDSPGYADMIETNESNTGGWGGSCVCPNGKVYQVGDRMDSCNSLA